MAGCACLELGCHYVERPFLATVAEQRPDENSRRSPPPGFTLSQCVEGLVTGLGSPQSFWKGTCGYICGCAQQVLADTKSCWFLHENQQSSYYKHPWTILDLKIVWLCNAIKSDHYHFFWMAYLLVHRHPQTQRISLAPKRDGRTRGPEFL